MKYQEKIDVFHLKRALEKLYKVTTDWDGKLYVGITLEWNYNEGLSDCRCQDMWKQNYTNSSTRNETPTGLTLPVDSSDVQSQQSTN